MRVLQPSEDEIDAEINSKATEIELFLLISYLFTNL